MLMTFYVLGQILKGISLFCLENSLKKKDLMIKFARKIICYDLMIAEYLSTCL